MIQLLVASYGALVWCAKSFSCIDVVQNKAMICF